MSLSKNICKGSVNNAKVGDEVKFYGDNIGTSKIIKIKEYNGLFTVKFNNDVVGEGFGQYFDDGSVTGSNLKYYYRDIAEVISK